MIELKILLVSFIYLISIIILLIETDESLKKAHTKRQKENAIHRAIVGLLVESGFLLCAIHFVITT